MKRILYTLACLMLGISAWADNVAKIGDTEYATLTAAISAVTADQTVTVTADCSISSEILIDKTVNLDLNGKTVTTNSCSAFQVKGGKLNLTGSADSKIVGSPSNYKLIYLYGSTDATASDYSVVNVGENVTVDCTNGYAVMLSANDKSGYGVKVNVDGTATGAYGGLYVNGNITKTDGNVPVFTVGEIAQIISTNGTAIYAAGYAEWSIAGNVTGKDTGIEIRAGKLDVTGGTIIGNGEVTNANPNGNGTTAVGAGIAVAQHTTKLPVDVKVSGGAIKGYTAFYQIDAQSNGEEALNKISLDITGGTFETINGGTNAIYSENKSGFVSGGTFNAPVPEEYCEEGFKPSQNPDGTYGVTEKNYVAQVGENKYESLGAAIEAATDGQTITLLANTTENVTIPAGKNITLDLNGKTLSGGSVASNGKKAAIVNKGTITIQDSSAEQTGTIKREDDDTDLSASNSYYVIDNQGTMTIKSGNVINNSGLTTAHKGSSLIRNGEPEAAVLNIEGGTLTQNNFDVIKNGGKGTLNISGGTINSLNSYAVLSYSVMNMTAGTVNGNVCLRSYTDSDEDTHGVGNISGGTINGDITVETYTGNTPNTLSECNISGTAVINGTLSIGEGNGNTFTANDENGTIAVSGGKFNSPVPEKYCVEGFIPTKNADGTYGVKEGSFVARIGEQGYETIAEAITAATDGQTIVLLADITKNVTIPAGKTLTIDLNGKAISYSTSAGAITNKGNLTIDDSAGGGKVVNTKTYNAIKNDGADAVLTIKNGIVESPVTSATSGTILNQYGTVNVMGGEVIGAKYPIYSGSSNAKGKTAVLNVSGGTLTSQTSYAAYITNGKACITGGTFNPADGFDDVYLYYGGLKAPETVSNNASAIFTSAEDGYVYSLAGAVNGATAGETVTMQKDANLVAAVTFNKDLILNLNGHNIISPVTAIKVTAGTLTIEGEGLVKGANPNAIAQGSDPYAAVWANGGNVIINGGTFDEGGVDGSGNSTIFINKAGTITINGGEFKNSASFGGKYWIFNIQDAVKETASIVAKGGKYHNFDPANNVNDGNPENMGTNYVADGYISVKIATSPYDIYEVKEGQWVASITDEAVKKFRYTSLDEAIDDANAAGKDITITLLANAETEKETLPANVTINANSKVLTMPSFVVLDGEAFTLPKITGTETYKVKTATYIRTNIASTVWGTVCLPFSLTSSNGANYYTYNNISGSTLTVDETTTVDPNTPVVFKKTKGGDLEINEEDAIVSLKASEASLVNGALVGTYTDANITADGLIYFINGDQFHKAQVSVKVPMYRAYIKYDAAGGAAPRALSIVVGGGDDATAIGTLTTGDADVEAIYDAAGRKLQAPQKGMNIMKLANGKTVKLIVK